RTAAVLGSSDVSIPNTQELSQVSPARKPAAPADGRTPLNTSPIRWEKGTEGRVRLRFLRLANDPLPSRGERGSVLIIVIWIAFGLVSLALYFAHSMSFEMRAADNRVAGMKAEEAIAGAARYVSNVLANAQQPGALPDTNTYRFAAVP